MITWFQTAFHKDVSVCVDVQEKNGADGMPFTDVSFLGYVVKPSGANYFEVYMNAPIATKNIGRAYMLSDAKNTLQNAFKGENKAQ